VRKVAGAKVPSQRSRGSGERGGGRQRYSSVAGRGSLSDDSFSICQQKIVREKEEPLKRGFSGDGAGRNGETSILGQFQEKLPSSFSGKERERENRERQMNSISPTE